ncbi:heterokaryon incompatibility protein-domain-containing protein [Xylaria flabelliformis]|nr:heterokaryon incompatibility protein-domain-containing protein [Xylaria flabelliformis]
MKSQDDISATFIPNPNPYLYPPLLQDPSAIRLVVLLPSAESHSDILCKLCNSTLGRSDTDKYEALSYVWGDSSKTKAISVNNKPFQATRNLESALRNLRYRNRYRVLWVDSMCINQSNVTERNAQVQQMDCIYKKAQRVIVWLGPESEDSSDAFDILNNRDRGPITRESLLYHVKAVYHLLERPWFKRVWCIQELALSKDAIAQCGQNIVSWARIRNFYQFCTHPTIRPSILWDLEEGIISSKQFAELAHALRYYSINVHKGGPGWQVVLSVLAGFRPWKASDPRDKISALYGLIPHEIPDREVLKPNYALGTAKIYTNTAIYILRKSRNLDILSIASWPVPSFHDISSIRLLPSWIPDWRNGHLSGLYWPIAFLGGMNMVFSFDDMYRASLNLEVTPVDLRSDL